MRIFRAKDPLCCPILSMKTPAMVAESMLSEGRDGGTKMCCQNSKSSLLAAVVILLSLPASARPSRRLVSPRDERQIRATISQWIEAYEHSDAKRLVSLEIPNVEVMDRFGTLHVLSGADENVKLWKDAFEVVSRKSVLPKVTIDDVLIVRLGVAVAHVSWDFPEGILLVDDTRIPAFSQLDTYVLIETKGEWLIALHNMQEKPAPLTAVTSQKE